MASQADSSTEKRRLNPRIGGKWDTEGKFIRFAPPKQKDEDEEE
jgi:hypothetical protein